MNKKRTSARVLAALLAAVALLTGCRGAGAGSNPPAGSTVAPSGSTESTTALELDAGSGLVVRQISRYAGSFVEDGSDDTVSGVCAITVQNTADQTVQYAKLTLTRNDESYEFEVTTLPPGASAQLLELNRKPAPDQTDGFAARTTLYTAFTEEPSLCADALKIAQADGAITVTNVSGSDIRGQIYVYYKIAYGDLYLGGITYRAGINGLATGQSATCYAGHSSEKYSKLMFATYVQ